MRLRDIALTSALLAGAAGIAAAQEPHMFDEIDVDGDGAVTLAELTAAFDDGAGDDPERFARDTMALQDMDDDGVISRVEAGSDGIIYEPKEDPFDDRDELE